MQAGTLSGNPVAVSAGLATLRAVQRAGFYEELGEMTQALVSGLIESSRGSGLDFCGQSVGGLFGIYFTKECPKNYTEALHSDTQRFGEFFHHMLKHGHYFAPSAFEAGFISAAHTQADIQSTIAIAKEFFTRKPR